MYSCQIVKVYLVCLKTNLTADIHILQHEKSFYIGKYYTNLKMGKNVYII